MKTKYFSSLIIATIFLLSFFLVTSISCNKSSSNSPATTGGGGTTATLNILSMTFPPSATVKLGTTIKWVNEDGFAHTVTSDDGTSFDSGNLAGGATFTYVASKAGSFPYHCNIHSSMTSTLIVNP